jgi:hypothetical protein
VRHGRHSPIPDPVPKTSIRTGIHVILTVVNIIGESLPGIGVPRYAVHGVERIRLCRGEIPVTQWSASSSTAPSYSPEIPEHPTGPWMPTAARAISATTQFAMPSLSLFTVLRFTDRRDYRMTWKTKGDERNGASVLMYAVGHQILATEPESRGRLPP